MKLLITTLIFMFISFVSKAEVLKVSDLYDYCSLYKNNNFKLKGLKLLDSYNALICRVKIESYIESGYQSCLTLNDIHKIIDKKTNMNFKIEERLIKILSDTVGNDLVTTKQGVLSFLNGAEKNPNLFKSYPLRYTADYLSSIFPCKVPFE